MSRIHTITYDQAKKWYDSGRKFKPIGTNLTKSIWLNYDEANDRYTLAYTHSKYYEIINEQGENGASYDWTGAFNRLVDYVREGLRNEQGAVEYVPARPEE